MTGSRTLSPPQDGRPFQGRAPIQTDKPSPGTGTCFSQDTHHPHHRPHTGEPGREQTGRGRQQTSKDQHPDAKRYGKPTTPQAPKQTSRLPGLPAEANRQAEHTPHPSPTGALPSSYSRSFLRLERNAVHSPGEKPKWPR